MVESIRRILAVVSFDTRHLLDFQGPLGFPPHPVGHVGGLDVERGEKDGDDGGGVGTDAFVAGEVEF